LWKPPTFQQWHCSQTKKRIYFFALLCPMDFNCSFEKLTGRYAKARGHDAKKFNSKWVALHCRVDRFFLVQHTKMLKHIPNDHNRYTKWP
jgi:hypothetical protein